MTVDEIFSKFGSAASLGKAIGRNPIRAAEMRKRGSIAPRYWPMLIGAAKEIGFDLSYEDLIAAHYPNDFMPPEKQKGAA